MQPDFTLTVTALLMIMLACSALALRKRHTYAVRLRVPARFESIRLLLGLVDEMARHVAFGEQAVYQCRLALDEACANIIQHAYANNPLGEIDVAMRAEKDRLTISLIDFGESFDPLAARAPAVRGSLEAASPGGLGLFLIRRVMDDVWYTPDASGNQLVMVKLYRRATMLRV
jgi:serine/threonine-protein kinase RsbW